MGKGKKVQKQQDDWDDDVEVAKDAEVSKAEDASDMQPAHRRKKEKKKKGISSNPVIREDVSEPSKPSKQKPGFNALVVESSGDDADTNIDEEHAQVRTSSKAKGKVKPSFSALMIDDDDSDDDDKKDALGEDSASGNDEYVKVASKKTSKKDTRNKGKAKDSSGSDVDEEDAFHEEASNKVASKVTSKKDRKSVKARGEIGDDKDSDASDDGRFTDVVSKKAPRKDKSMKGNSKDANDDISEIVAKLDITEGVAPVLNSKKKKAKKTKPKEDDDIDDGSDMEMAKAVHDNGIGDRDVGEDGEIKVAAKKNKQKEKKKKGAEKPEEDDISRIMAELKVDDSLTKHSKKKMSKKAAFVNDDDVDDKDSQVISIDQDVEDFPDTKSLKNSKKIKRKDKKKKDQDDSDDAKILQEAKKNLNSDENIKLANSDLELDEDSEGEARKVSKKKKTKKLKSDENTDLGEKEKESVSSDKSKERLTVEQEASTDEQKEIRIKTAAEKKAEKKERDKKKKESDKKKILKQKAKQSESVVPAGEAAESKVSSTLIEAEAKTVSAEKDGAKAVSGVIEVVPSVESDHGESSGGEDGAAGSKDKKKKKKKKKTADEDKKKTKKPGKSAISKMQEALEEVKREQERLRLEEEAKQRAFEEAEEKRLAKIQMELERKERKKQKEKERKERLKKEGKLLTPAQREQRRRAEAMLEAMKQQLGVEIPAMDSAEPVQQKKKVMYGKKKKATKGQSSEQELSVGSELPSPEKTEESFNDGASAPVKEASDHLEEEQTKPVIVESEVINSWDQLDEDRPVADSWDAIEELEAEEHAAEEPKAKQAKVLPTKPELAQTQASVDVEESEEETEDESESEEEESEDESESEEDEESTDEESSEDESSSDEDEDDDDDKKLTPEKIKERAKERILKRRMEAEARRTTDKLRAPVICVLGHVDTGKTKILDKIRHTNVQDGEAGGITQQIGATNIPKENIKEQCKMIKEFQEFDMKLPGLLVIDTPGHESFSNLRSRGSNLCDMAILVVDIMHGLEPQTIESINLLRKKHTPFVVALNKIDRIFEWKKNPQMQVEDTIKKQKNRITIQEFEERSAKVITELAEQGLNAALFYKNPDPKSYISLVPTSAHSGDGMADLIFLICKLTQSRLAKKLAYSEELESTVMEVKQISGLGTTIDVILVNGKLKEGDTIITGGIDGAVVTQIRSVLTPQPMRELRVKAQYIHHQVLEAAQGAKLCAKDLERVLAGSPLYVAQSPDEIEVLKEEVEEFVRTSLASIKVSERGVYVQASTLGSLEALLEFLKSSKIPYCGVNIGPVHKRDTMKCSVMLEHEPMYAVILAFDVKVERDAQEYADREGVRIFTADIIYHLFDKFTAYCEEYKAKKRDEFKHLAVYPSKFHIMPEHIFNTRDPIVVGVHVDAGTLRLGTPLVVLTKEGLVNIGFLTGLEANHKPLEKAAAGMEVCAKIEPVPGEAPKLLGRHFTYEDIIISKISRESIDVMKQYFREDMQKADWQLIIELKKLLDIV